nr:MAG TPA: hypothetical protein [Caudoviricetes sp.]DAM89573.1 MAG TPA: hypothetical protein [Caudoviricetes sp.]DAM90045.1 MAG TPA: hypothetical protein [Caudoviricetes sp.]DAP44270.1 MAG TPA: hypothetical protein [Caudoviricetes sp.]
MHYSYYYIGHIGEGHLWCVIHRSSFVYRGSFMLK